MLIVGLTGSIATGKSTISDRLKTHYKFHVVDADKIAKEEAMKGKPAYKKIVEYFTPISEARKMKLLQPDGELDRLVLSRLVFGESNLHHLIKLNSFLHTRILLSIFREIIKQYVCGASLVVLDIPLLFETNFNLLCGKVINVTCDPEIQIQRLLKRNPELTEKDAKQRIKSQFPMETKMKLADYNIVNDGTMDELYDQLNILVEGKVRPYDWWLFLLWALPPLALIVVVIVVIKNWYFLLQSKKIRAKQS